MSKQANTGYVISPLQRRVWQLSELDGGPCYRVRGEVRIEGELDRARLLRAVESVVERHEALRTSLQMLPGISIPVQVVEDRQPVAFEEGNGSGEVDGGVCFTLTQEGGERHRLRISASAIFMDEASVNLVAREIA